MSGYILSVLGIVLAGVLIDIIIPNGAINKYIKSIYSIFVVAVLLSPAINYISKAKNITLQYQNVQINTQLLNHIAKQQVSTKQKNIENDLKQQGFNGVSVILEYSLKNDDISIISCTVNLENLSISSSNKHINKYEFISKVVNNHTNLNGGEIVFNE